MRCSPPSPSRISSTSSVSTSNLGVMEGQGVARKGVGWVEYPTPAGICAIEGWELLTGLRR